VCVQDASTDVTWFREPDGEARAPGQHRTDVTTVDLFGVEADDHLGSPGTLGWVQEGVGNRQTHAMRPMPVQD
jgi:hypothetical protein